MSGAYGHINHLYENGDLKFNDLKKIFIAASEGKLQGTEKTDGINLYLSYSSKDQEVKAARNLGHLKEGGVSAEELYELFSDKEKNNKNYNPNIKEALSDAIANFEKAVMALDMENQTDIFGDHIATANFYNCEVLDERVPNVISYETKLVVVHRDGHKGVDLNTKKIYDLDSGTESKFISRLEKLQDNDKTEKFPIQVNSIRHLDSLSSNEILNSSINSINKILLSCNLTDDNTINEYLVVRLSRYLNKFDIPALNKKLVIKKILGIKGLNTNDILRGLPQETKREIRDILSTSKEILKKLIEPIELIVYRFSREVLKGLQSVYNLDQAKSNNIIRNKLIASMETLNDKDSQSLNTLRKQLQYLNVKKLSLPLEGFVFQYDGKVYKLTGDFAPINKLLNFTDKTYDFAKNNTLSDVAIFPGSFKPPHAGHLNAVKELTNLASKVLIIISQPTQDINKRFIVENDENMYEITAEQSKKIFDEYLKKANLDSRVETIIANNPVKKAKEIITSDPRDSKMYVVSCGADDKQLPVLQYLSNNQNNVKTHILKSKKSLHSTNFRNDLVKRNPIKIVKYLPDEFEDKNEFANNIIDIIFNQDIAEENSAEQIIQEIITKRKGKFCLLSKATKRNLGCYRSRAGAVKREKQVQYFKHVKEMSTAGAVAGYAGNAFSPQKRSK